jgi:hypothetical protein
MTVTLHAHINGRPIQRRYYQVIPVPADSKAVGVLQPVPLRHVLLHTKYNPSQPRVPRGNPDGGQWTDDLVFGGDGVPHRAASRKPQPLTNQELALAHRDAITPVYPLEVLAPALRANRAARQIIAILRRTRKPPPLRGRTDTERAAEAAQRLREAGWNDTKRLQGQLGPHKKPVEWYNKTIERGWTAERVRRVRKMGKTRSAINDVNKGNPATRYDGSSTNEFFVQDDATGDYLLFSDKLNPNFKLLSC